VFALPEKKAVMKCPIDSGIFAESIISEESMCDHTYHQPKEHNPNLLKDSIDIKKISNKFGLKPFFSEKFWTKIAENMFTSKDQNIQQFSSVSTVQKSKGNPLSPKSWRLIWRSDCIIKFYDLLKSEFINQSESENTAYRENSSTMVALTKVFSNDVEKNNGFFCCDFMNAFGKTCRTCTNQIFGTEILPTKLFYDITSNNKTSPELVSLVGTCAGRPTGDPHLMFNTILNCIFISPTIKSVDIAAYADDSIKFKRYRPGNTFEYFQIYK